SAGVPLSVTLTTIIFVFGPCTSDGVQVKTPVFGFTLTPAGADAKLNVSELAGMSASVAGIVTTSVLSSGILRSAMGANTGALFTSLTATVKLLVSLNGGEPSSVTTTVTRLVLGRWASVGVQVSTPLLGSKLMPSGADCRLKVSLLAGRSESVAKLVTTSVASPWITLSGGTVSTGALFTLL